MRCYSERRDFDKWRRNIKTIALGNCNYHVLYNSESLPLSINKQVYQSQNYAGIGGCLKRIFWWKISTYGIQEVGSWKWSL